MKRERIDKSMSLEVIRRVIRPVYEDLGREVPLGSSVHDGL